MRYLWTITALLLLAFSPPSLATEPPEDEIIAHVNEQLVGDLDEITKRGFLRVLTVHNPLFFTFDGARKKGAVAEITNLLEAHLDEEIGKVRSPTIVVIPVLRDELIPSLVEGRGDIVMGLSLIHI